MRAFLAWSLLVVLAVSGCTSRDPEDPDDQSASTSTPTPISNATEAPLSHDEAPLTDEEAAIIDASRASAAAPAKFRERTQLIDCGEKKLTSLTGTDPRQFDCLLSSDRFPNGELVILRRTVEGDPVVTYYRVGSKIDGIEVFSDNSLDRFGSEDWTHRRYTLDELIELGI